ncbi:C-type lectin lectoxin-Lio2-like isoform X4 [Alosa sapidissima]|uniref:C-type lectin lectoxin-Lio2-like isoform X4 n=1 Tax=Alosa sapidissima TaxID=34773 RepID=UPI001C080E13|nr:C-type lectin lectoxin-Lio2-like isoform X4 [Alosa sapidissima]
MTLLLLTTLLVSGLGSLSSSVPRQFHVVKEQKSWTEAQQYCREEFTDLATIDDMTEMEKVKSMIQEAGAGDAWIGLKTGEWQWSLADRDFYRENEAEFRNWYPGQPGGGGGEECVGMIAGTWHDYWCSSSSPFICYDDPKEVKSQIVRVELQVASHVIINDPAVQQAFVQQIQQRLRESGMPAGAKLTWRTQPDGQIFKEKEKKEEGRKRTEL